MRCREKLAGNSYQAPIRSLPDVRFKVTYDNGAVRSTFGLRANLQNSSGINTILNANSRFTLIIDGKYIGKVTTDTHGMIGVVFFSSPKGTELLLPLTFPTLHAGMKIQIDNLVFGTFQYKAEA